MVECNCTAVDIPVRTQPSLHPMCSRRPPCLLGARSDVHDTVALLVTTPARPRPATRPNANREGRRSTGWPGIHERVTAPQLRRKTRNMVPGNRRRLLVLVTVHQDGARALK